MDTERVMEVLRQVEWVGGWPKSIGGTKHCPWCERWEYEGHADDCKLAALLNKEKEQREPLEKLGAATACLEAG